MTQRALNSLIDTALDRFSVQAVRIVHRVGRLEPQEPIVYVGVTSAHRQAAFDACGFLMDQLKTTVPFWKKEYRAGGAHWVAARESDALAAGRWQRAESPAGPGQGSEG
jgi:molybdopterin synthase catalytic subunit